MPVDQLTYVDTQPDLSMTKTGAFRDKLRILDFADSKKKKIPDKLFGQIPGDRKIFVLGAKISTPTFTTRKFCFSTVSFVHVGRISSLEKRLLKFSEQIYPCAFNL